MKTPLSSTLLLLALLLPVRAEDVPVPEPAPEPVMATIPPGHLVLEFRGARLGQILDFLSQQAGYVIANPVELAQPITLVAKAPMTPEQAIEALNSVILTQGYAVIARGRTLHVLTLAAAKQQNLPVFVGSDPARIPETDTMVTQIMPVQFATVRELAENLQPLLNSSSATLSANEAANVIILTDTQAHIKRIAGIIHAIDSSVGGEIQVRVFHLANADAEKVATVINTIYGKSTGSGGTVQNMAQMFANRGGGNRGGQGGNQAQADSAARGVEVSAAADSGTNSLLVRASPSVFASLAEIIAQIDVDTTARENVLVYKVRNGKAADIAASLSSLFEGLSTGGTTANAQARGNAQGGPGGQGGPAAPATQGGQSSQGRSGATAAAGSTLDLSGQVRIVADVPSNSVLVLSMERNFDRLEKMLVDLDQPMRQVLIRVLMAEVTYEKNLDLGVELAGYNPPGASTSSRMFSNFGTFDPTLGSTLGFNGFLLNTDEFQASVRALATNTRFDVLSRPYILTTDNQEAIVNVSENVPVINGTRTDQNNNVTTTFDRQDVGIILTVTPQINSDGRVLLDVNQVLSALTDQSIAVSDDLDSPVIKQRTMTTRVSVGSGQTVVVGGLVFDSMTEVVAKIPILGDIPFLGIFFRRTQSRKTKTELLLFLTPQVLTDSADLDAASRTLRGEMSRLDAAVEKGLLQRHLDQLANLKVGQSVPLPQVPAVNADAAQEE